MKHSPLHAAVLALVLERPSHTYDVWQRFDERFGSLLPVSSSRIYQVMNMLEDRGLVEQLPPDEQDRRRRQPRPDYRATLTGARTHREWLAQEMRDDPLRAELQRRLLSVTVNDTSVILDLVNRYERACVDEMAETRRPRASSGAESRAAVVAVLRERLMAEERRLMLEARLRWVAFARVHTQAAAEQIARLRDER